jgi:endonuclease/exonuclease/phosphatase family metal-dependent hydrolase
MFFNTENYFDTFDDEKTLDDDFTPTGSYHWTWEKFSAKRNALSKIIIAVGKGKIPAIVGLCEIENRFVLDQLVNETPLAKFNYRIVHHDSPDSRGIDVALLYDPACFELLYQNFYEISKDFKTREILYVKGIFHGVDTLHVFVTHFPSKRGGAKASESRRTAAAMELKRLCDSVGNAGNNANILIMGDFNDTPNSEPVTNTLHAKDSFDRISERDLYNLALPLMKKGEGTIKFQGVWEFIDLMFVSGNMLNGTGKISCRQSDFKVFDAPYLFENDNTYVGKKPKRTFIGMKYNGGISDHLPVYIQLTVEK